MGRPRRPLNAVADVAEVRARLKDKRLESWQTLRLRAVQMGLEGRRSLHEIADKSGVSPRSVGEWFDRFRSSGLTGLLHRKPKGKGPASWLDARTARELQMQLAQGHWHRAEEVRPWLEEKLHRKLSLVVIYKYLGKYAMRRGGSLVPKMEAASATTRSARPEAAHV